jgi:hypothetical protein
MKSTNKRMIDGLVIFLFLLFTVLLFVGSEPESLSPQQFEELQSRALSSNKNEKTALIHLFESQSAISQRQITELNRLMQRHSHLFVFALSADQNGCDWMLSEGATYYCMADSLFAKEVFQQTSNVVYLPIDTEPEFWPGYYSYQDLIHRLGLEF